MKTPSSSGLLRVEITPRSIFYVLATVAGVWLFLKVWIIALLLVITLVFVGTLNPVVESLQKRGMSRGRALLVTFAALSIAAVLFLGLTVPALIEQITQIAQDAPRHRLQLIGLLEQREQTVPLARILRETEIAPLTAQLQTFILGYSMTAIEVVGYLVTTLFLAYYVLADGKRMQGALYSIFPREYHMRLARILHNLEVIVGGYIRGQLITSAAITVFTFVLLVACGVPNPLALALFAGLADVIPFVGGFLATAPAVVAALPVGAPATLVVFVALCAYQEFENRILVPRVYGHVLRLSPAVVVVALLTGGMLLGIIGALLALPIAAGLQMIVAELRVEMPGDDSHDAKAQDRNEKTEAVYEKRSAGASAPDAGQIAHELAQDIRSADVTIAVREASDEREANAPGETTAAAEGKMAANEASSAALEEELRASRRKVG